MDNMEIYNRAKCCPENALRPIQAGRLKGKSDINPMWRIKTLTELFGPCGVGWKPDNVKYWTEPGAEGEVSAWCSVELRIKTEGQWSEAVHGVGGSMLVNTEKGRLVTNDEAYKMAYTDAISVCCKLLGFAADVYWQNDRTKYSGGCDPEGGPPRHEEQTPQAAFVRCQRCGHDITAKKNRGRVYTPEEIAAKARAAYGSELCWECMVQLNGQKAGEAG